MVTTWYIECWRQGADSPHWCASTDDYSLICDALRQAVSDGELVSIKVPEHATDAQIEDLLDIGDFVAL